MSTCLTWSSYMHVEIKAERWKENGTKVKGGRGGNTPKLEYLFSTEKGKWGGASWAGRKNERGRRKDMRRQPKRASQPGEHSAAWKQMDRGDVEDSSQQTFLEHNTNNKDQPSIVLYLTCCSKSWAAVLKLGRKNNVCLFLTVLIKYKIRLFMVDLIRYALISRTLTALGTEVAIAKSNRHYFLKLGCAHQITIVHKTLLHPV